MISKTEGMTVIAALLTAVAAFCSILDYASQPPVNSADIVNEPTYMNVRFVFTENDKVYAIDHDKNLIAGNSTIIFRVA